MRYNKSMILNVSGRTDIIAFYEPWFENRYRAGFVDVRNPFNYHQVSRINFSDVDAFVFCTKNPAPIIDFLPEITQPIIFHTTLTGYLSDIEPFVPNKSAVLQNIKQVSKLISPERTYVRYDPILLSDKYTVDYHLAAFDKLCRELAGVVNHFIVSFVDIYKNVEQNMAFLKLRDFTEEDYRRIGQGFSKSAAAHGQTVQTCFEQRNLAEYGFTPGECMSHELARELTGKDFPEWTARKDHSSRDADSSVSSANRASHDDGLPIPSQQERNCHCVQMVDIGSYNSCGHRCKYCYANFDEGCIAANFLKHDPASTLLLGALEPDDVVTVRKDNALKKNLRHSAQSAQATLLDQQK